MVLNKIASDHAIHDEELSVAEAARRPIEPWEIHDECPNCGLVCGHKWGCTGRVH
jgi:hypothetical protein